MERDFDYVIRMGTICDLNQVVAIHRKRFPNFFLSSLGNFFLRQFYKALLKEPGLLVVLEYNDNIKGFAAGAFSNNQLYKRLLLNNLSGFLQAGIYIMFVKSWAILRLYKNMKRESTVPIDGAVLLSIATVANSKGYGVKLLHSFENQILEKTGINTISLTTDAIGNSNVINFYIKCGYTIFNSFYSIKNRKMIRFIKKLKK